VTSTTSRANPQRWGSDDCAGASFSTAGDSLRSGPRTYGPDVCRGPQRWGPPCGYCRVAAVSRMIPAAVDTGGVVDPFLVDLLTAAETGTTVPTLVLVTQGGDLVYGSPVPSREFAGLVRDRLSESAWNSLKQRPRRLRKEDPGDPDALATSTLNLLGRTKSDDPVVTLANVRILWSGRGGGVDLPATRVPLSAVTAWWFLGTGREVKAGSGVSFGVGASSRSAIDTRGEGPSHSASRGRRVKRSDERPRAMPRLPRRRSTHPLTPACS
jgi:hypothetical protein